MLRDYQSEICQKVWEAFLTHRSVMMQMPTGTGKTVVLASLVKQCLEADADCSVLIVAHRIELIEQTGALLERFGIDYGVVAGGRWPALSKRVTVASIQTLSTRRCPQGDALSPTLVIIDEAHHALAKTYKMLWAAWPAAKFLGLTATPYRMSGEGFMDLFEVLAVSRSIKQFIAEGWLSPYDYYSIRPDSGQQLEIDALKKRGADGDFQLKEMREKLDVRPSIEKLFESFEKCAVGKKGIVYAIDIAHAEHIAGFYRQQGVQAVAISSKTPPAERQRLLALFKKKLSPAPNALDGSNGSDGSNNNVSDGMNENGYDAGALQILVSVDLFSEGFDCPDVEFIQLARPTLSLAKYLQMVGRGLRPCQGKLCCTIIDNVGLYRTFGLPSADRDWETFFAGNVVSGMRKGGAGPDNEQFLWLGCGELREENDADIVKIVSHEGMQAHFTLLGRTGFERRKKGKTWVWTDALNGVEFDCHPQVVNYRGIELSTADGETFFPRLRSKWMDAQHGINRKALETRVGEGIGWMKLYISFAMPDRVLRLQSVSPNQARIYKDEHGTVYLQQDLDHTPVSEQEAGGRKRFMNMCDKQQQAWEEMKRGIRMNTLKYDFKKRWWRTPEGSIMEPCDDEGNDSLYHIIFKADGERNEFWVDAASGFTYRHRPVIRKRGFVELLYDGEVIYLLNIREERFMPYRNWEIRADERICTIGNKLYFSQQKDEGCYWIKRRSDDFRMFVVAERCPNENPGQPAFDEFMIINKAGQQLEIARAT